MQEEIENIKKYLRAANYITASQIYLQKNFLLENELTFDDIKPRLLGHWGTCPGINFVYAHLNNYINKYLQKTLFVLGPGHGFPALQANLFIEKTLEEFYPKATQNYKGLGYISKNFSWPFGFPSHSSPITPGVILEGGELGYSLSTSFGAVMDNPDLMVPCLIGDGEAETGPLAASWHLNKFIDPRTNGIVLPILHLNGYKISGPTIFGRMSYKDLNSLFTGYGYEPIFVDESKGQIHAQMINALDKCHEIVQEIKSTNSDDFPRLPMIILKTPKGWDSIKELNGERIEGNNLSHQVIAGNAKSSYYELKALENWLRSYKIDELFDKEKGFVKEVKKIVPPLKFRMGKCENAYPKQSYKELNLPDPEIAAEDVDRPGILGSSSMRRVGDYLTEVFQLNHLRKNFRLFSPDETYSNKLDNVFKQTQRAFLLPTSPWDKDMNSQGRVLEILSEHSLQGLMQGYILTGRHGIFASYEAFVQIVSSMVDQYAKFLKIAREVKWRGDIGSLNYILTSSGWRQDHNGFSHQNPGFVSGLVEKREEFIKFYYPSDGNSTLAVLNKCLRSKNQINIITAGKTLEPRWLSIKSAKEQLEQGLSIWDFASENNPDIVLSGIGDYMTKECLAAINLLKKENLNIKIRFVNVVDLTSLETCDFDTYFTKNKPVIFNFHGYPDTLKKLLFKYHDNERFHIHGYIENGSTTTPFDMQVRNHTSRYQLIIEIIELLSKSKKLDDVTLGNVIIKYRELLLNHKKYIKKYGIDPEEIEKWEWEE